MADLGVPGTLCLILHDTQSLASPPVIPVDVQGDPLDVASLEKCLDPLIHKEIQGRYEPGGEVISR